ncbi:MarR family transcriptional regulator [Catellatospora sp. TT07R-123]|uniref:MarR family winged helix-turn-helix transcriptional regulator n=1 Tax=Catellatospora sp. TT07R-123 TaxID=2733863 RepID=UPI001B052CE6|nr:MarR family transcriptional regulator [Catellatospora sp. TT07R-123]GHJ45122.1 MarR family transcriptional regulator [Catellatospora sp. TT07R-123]
MDKRLPDFAALGGGSMLHQVSRELTNLLDRQFAEHGLTTQQAALLMHAAGGPVTPSSLRADLGTDTAGMTRLVDRLESKGLLRRSPHAEDRRAVVIELTPAGRALLPLVPPIFGRTVGRMFADFAPAEMAQFNALLRRAHANLTMP